MAVPILPGTVPNPRTQVRARRWKKLAAATVTLALAFAAAVTWAAPAKPAGSSASTPQQRAPTQAERDSFAAFWDARQASAPRGPWSTPSLFAPAFEVERLPGQPWRVIARMDSAPRRTVPELCRQVRSSFVHDAGAPPGQRWHEAAEAPRWYVWLATPNVPCTPARYTTLMDPRVPGNDVVALLRQHRELLLRARLLFAGHSQCARQRSLIFRLAAIEPAPAAGNAQMFSLVFESDRDTVARVAVRKYRNEYTAWNVSCAG